MTSWVSRSLLVALSVVLLTAVGSAQNPVDPQSLIGDWVGNVEGPVEVKYTLTISRVDGNRVWGSARAVTSQGQGQYPIEGTVDGNVLKYKSTTHDLVAELVIDGTTMKGTGERTRSGAVGKFNLRRAK